MQVIRAYWLGFVDGWQEPEELGSGLTWSPADTSLTWAQCSRLNEAYDRGVNHGQILGGIVQHVEPQPWHEPKWPER